MIINFIINALRILSSQSIPRDIVFGLELHDLWRLGVLAAWLVVAGIVTVLFFRWE